MQRVPLVLLLFIFISAIRTNAQVNTSPAVEYDKVTIGLGMGLDYGGFGGNVLYYPVKNVGIFGGIGYALAGTGYNAGLKLRLIPQKQSKVIPYAIAMYGYNAAIYVMNDKRYNKLFYGPSFGLGLDAPWNPIKKGYFSFALLYPVRGKEVDNYITDLKKNHNIEFKTELFPVAFSFGFRFIL